MIDTDRVVASKIPKWRYDEIERKVVDLYIEQDIHSFPLDPFKILEKRGYKLIPFSKFGIEACPELVNDDNDAFSFYSPEYKTHLIIYNDEKPLQRIRFTLMHELGHIDLGHKGESDLARREADAYAGYALAPSPLISKYASEDAFEIMSAFWVSRECADVRSYSYTNWKQYGGRYLKDYEIVLVNLFK